MATVKKRTDEGQPRPKYNFNKCGTNIYFFNLQRFGPSPSPNFKALNGLIQVNDDEERKGEQAERVWLPAIGTWGIQSGLRNDWEQ